MATTKVTDGTFETDVLGSGVPVLVDFWAEWCGPCKMIGPALEEISEQLQGKVSIVKINIDENPATPQRYGVQAIPTLIMFKDGEPVAKKLGALPKGQLAQWIQSSI